MMPTPKLRLGFRPGVFHANDPDQPFWLVIHVGGLVERHLAPPSLADLQGAVRGNIEAYQVTHPRVNAIALGNEDAHAMGLLANPYAWSLTGLHLLGPLVLIGGADAQGDFTQLDPPGAGVIEAYVRGTRN